MGQPGVHVGGVKGGLAEVADMTEVKPQSGRVVDEFIKIAGRRRKNGTAGGGGEDKVHVPGKKVSGAGIHRGEDAQVVRQVGNGTKINVPDAAEDGEGGQSQAFIHIEGEGDLGVELRLGQGHGLAEADDAGEIVLALAMADVEGSAVLFLVVAKVDKVRPELALERDGKFNRLEVSIQRLARFVGAVEVEDRAVCGVLLLDEETAVSGQEQDGGAGLAGSRGNEVAKVAVLTVDAGVMEHVHDVDLILLPHDRGTAGTVDADTAVHATKQVCARKGDVVTDVILAITRAAGGRTMQAHAGVVENLGAIVNDRATHP